MMKKNTEKFVVLNQIWNSIRITKKNDWEIKGFKWEIPKKGDEIKVHIRFVPLENTYYIGELSFGTKLKNTNQIELSDVFKETSIGLIENNSDNSLLNKLKKLYKSSDIEWNKIDIAKKESNSFVVIPSSNSKYYKGFVKFYFEIGINLDNVITERNLGYIEDFSNNNTILKRLKEKNRNIDLNEVEVQKNNSNQKTAIIIAKVKSTKYLGKVEVGFNITSHISKFVSNSNLGTIENPTYDKIKKIITKTNPNLKINYFVLNTNLTNYSIVSVTGNVNENVYGDYVFKYNSTISKSIDYDSGLKSVESYANYYIDDDFKDNKRHFTVVASLGKANFIEKFSEIKFSVNLKSWHNGNKGTGDFKNYDTETISIEINATGSKVTLYKSYYKKVNWMQSYSDISYVWSGNVIKFKAYTVAEAHAQRRNAAWAKSQSQTKVNTLSA